MKIGRYLAVFIFVLMGLLSGCFGPEGQSRELYDLAQFEEQQRNFQSGSRVMDSEGFSLCRQQHGGLCFLSFLLLF